MRLDYDSILQQTFKKSLRGYSKEEVRDFLQLVANDFKDMKRDLKRLQEALEEKDRRIRELTAENTAGKTRQASNQENWRASLQEKARQFVNQARSQADRHKQKVEAEVSHLREDIRRLKKEKQHLTDNLKTAAPAVTHSRTK